MKVGTILSYAGVFVALVLCGFLLKTWAVGSGAEITTPWQVIPSYSIYVFLALSAVVGFVVALGRQPKIVSLGLLVVFSFSIFSYVPLSHTLLYGADGWRHLANVNRMLSGIPWSEVATSSSPLAAVGRLSYFIFWGFIALPTKLLPVSALSLMRWLLPVVAAVAMPALAFWLGRAIGFGRRHSLLTAWFLHFPFALNMLGVFTLPVSFWFFPFVAAVALLISRAKSGTFPWVVAAASFALLCLGYSLYPLLYALLAVLLALDYKAPAEGKLIVLSVFSIVLGLVIPLIELFILRGSLLPITQIGRGMVQMFGNVTGYYLASGPRPHDIATGNVFFNQTPMAAFVPTMLTAWRWWILVFMIVFLASVAIGIYRLLKYGDRGPQMFALFTISIALSYVLGRYTIAGEQTISRRLDGVLALCAVFCCMAAVEWLIEIIEKRGRSIVPLVASFIVLGSLVMTASISLGPDTQTVSAKSYSEMQRVAEYEAAHPANHHCVVADTYPLLALQALSAGRIVGGGFPINSTFSQPELDLVYNNLKANGVDSFHDVNYAFGATGATHCWFVTNNGLPIKIGD